MNNPETLTTLTTQYIRRRQTKHNTAQKIKKMSNTDLPNTGDEPTYNLRYLCYLCLLAIVVSNTS